MWLKLSSFALVALCLFTGAQAQQWNSEEAQIALRLSWAAYCPPRDVTAWDCYWCRYRGTPALKMIGVTIDGGTNTMGYVGYYDKTIYVVFRGTTNLKNVLVDVQFVKSQVWSDKKDVKVHSGFGKSWKALSQGILHNIETARSRCTGCNRVMFTGHSLGGAISTIAAADYARVKPSNLAIQSITLGSPRVGNDDFAEYVTRLVPNSIRWTNGNDPVPHLPLHMMGFDHRPREVWQSSPSSSYKLCSQTNGEDSSCANSVSGFSLSAIDKHSSYGGLDLHSGSCDTFKRDDPLTEEDIQDIIDAAYLDVRSFQHKGPLESN